MKISRRGRTLSPGIAALALAVWFAAAASASTVRLVSGGRPLPEEYSPIITASGFMVPLSLAEWFGAVVQREDDAFIVRRAGKSAELVPGVAAARLGQAEQPIGAAPIEVDGELYVPLRFLGDFLGLKISWDVAGNTLDLSPWSSNLVRHRTSPGTPFAPELPAPAAGAASPVPTASLGLGDTARAAISASLVVPGTSPGAALTLRGPAALTPGSGVSVREESSASERVRAAIERLLRRLQGALQADPGWIELERATGVRLVPVRGDAGWEYRIRGVAAERLTTAKLVDPPRLIVDIAGVPGTRLDPFTTPDPLAHRVRAMEFGGQLRLVFDLSHSVGHRIEEDGDGVRLIFFRPLSAIDVSVTAAGGRIGLDVPGNTAYNITRLTAPDRLVFDLYDTSLVAEPAAHGPFEGPVRQVRVAQFQPDVTRIVLEVASETKVEVAASERGLALVWGDQVGKVAYRRASAREFHVGVDVPRGAHVRVLRLTHPDRLVMDVVGMKLNRPLEEALFLEGPVSRLRVSQYDEQTTRIVADLRHHVRYALAEEMGRVVLVMQEPLLAGRTLTVDAGHGGVDGGAVGTRLGILEKDINLDIALRLQALLERAEAGVHMTRVDDTFVDLWSRADLANETKSDVLVSIHANSAPDGAAKGTETYVRTGEPDSERLGAAIQRSLTSALSTVDRGVRPNRYLVIRRAEMPAALVEVAFLANPEEEELLAEEWFRQRAAEGIYNGLLRYFYPDDRLEDGVNLEEGPKAPWTVLQEAAPPAGVGAAS